MHCFFFIAASLLTPHPCRRVRRLTKDTARSKKEIASQEERIEAVKADSSKDEHDVRKQTEVLDEYKMGLGDELSRLLTAYEGLEGYCAELSEDNKNIMETDEAAKAKTVLEEAKVVLKEHDKLDED